MNKPPEISSIDPVSKAAVLLEALPYIQRFRGSKFVVKYGGSFMDDPDPAISLRVITDLVFLSSVGIHVIVVHGGGKAISRAMEAAGLEPTFKNGLRVTDQQTIDIAEHTLNREVNANICTMMQKQGGLPAGLEGNKIFSCQQYKPQDETGQSVDLGYVGEIVSTSTELIEKYIHEGFTPIISPIALDQDGQAYNTNADVAAAAVASAVHARRLVYLSDVPGLMEDPDKPESLISTLNVKEVDDLKQRGVIGKGMLPKVDSAVSALENGVRRVHFIDGRMPHSTLLEIFTNKGIGTEIVQDTQPWRPEALVNTRDSS